jgi:hypothetical protein
MCAENVDLDEIDPYHIPECWMVADPLAKYLSYEVWNRHMHYMMNHDQWHPEVVPAVKK